MWGGVESAERVSTGVKTGVSAADAIIGTSHAIEDISCGDYICGTLDVIGSVSSTTGIILARVPGLQQYTSVTTSITVCCRGVRWYCRKYGTVWGCVIAGGKGLKEGAKFVLSK